MSTSYLQTRYPLPVEVCIQPGITTSSRATSRKVYEGGVVPAHLNENNDCDITITLKGDGQSDFEFYNSNEHSLREDPLTLFFNSKDRFVCKVTRDSQVVTEVETAALDILEQLRREERELKNWSCGPQLTFRVLKVGENFSFKVLGTVNKEGCCRVSSRWLQLTPWESSVAEISDGLRKQR